ncbi:MAG: twin-arginine translocase subunit TatC, partial [Brevibacterium aurantiacum]
MKEHNNRRSASARRKNPERKMPVVGHLIELRNRSLVAAIAIALGAVAGWFLYDPVLDILQEPIRSIRASGDRTAEINFAGVASPFDLKIKLSFFIGIFLSCPIWLYEVWAFIVPGLTKKEKLYS